MRCSTIHIDAAQIEFVDGGNTIWVHGPEGGTVIRIKTLGKITTERCTTSPISHADIVVRENVHICLAKGGR